MKTFLRGIFVIGACVPPLVISMSCASTKGTGSETHFICGSDEACVAADRGNRCIEHVCRTVAERGDAGLDASPGAGGGGPRSNPDSSVGTGGTGNGGAGGASSGGGASVGGTASDAGVDAGCGNTTRDNANCGSCGNVCPGTTTCRGGRCECNGCGNPNAIAVDGASVYWTTDGGGLGGGAVMKMPASGGTPTTLALEQYGHGLAVDGTSAYYFGAVGSAGRVMKVSLGGGTPVTLASSPSNPSALAIDATSVYWVNISSNGANSPSSNGAVMKVPLAGGTPTTLVGGLGSLGAVAVDATSVYWTDMNDTTDRDGSLPAGAVMKVPLTGGTPTLLASAPAGRGIAVDATSVYWTGGDSVMRIPLTGGMPTTLASGQNNPRTLAIDAANVYWTTSGSREDGSDGTVMKAPLTGGTPTTLASGQDWVWSIAVDATRVYWTDPITDTVKRAFK